MNNLKKDIVSECYSYISRDLDQIAGKFVRRYGGDYEEVRAEADYQFLIAHYKYESSRGGYSHWIKSRVRVNLLEKLRKEIMRNNRLPRIKLNLESQEDPVLTGGRFWDGLSEDARFLTFLVLESPRELARGLGGPDPRGFLFHFLRRSGWTVARIIESFNEIKETL